MRLIRNGIDVRLGCVPWCVAHYWAHRYVGECADGSGATVTHVGVPRATSAYRHFPIELIEADRPAE
jgi:hypothetical protein